MRIFLDRIDKDQNGLPVVTFEVDEKYISFSTEQMPNGFADSLIPNAIVECEIVDGAIVSPVILYEETRQKEEEMKKRLRSLFKRKN